MSTTTYATTAAENGLSNGGASLRFEPSKLNTSSSSNSSNKVKTVVTSRKMNGTQQSQPTGDKLDEAFKAAVEAIKSLPKNGPFQPSNEMLLKFYAYYKQATLGPVKTSRPSMFKVVERAKYDAWNSVRTLSREEAMQGYIDEIKNIIETMPHSQHVEKFMNAIGPFYEYVGDDEDENNNNNNNNEDEDDEDEDDDELARNNTSEEAAGGKELIIDSSKHEIDDDGEEISTTTTTTKRINGVTNNNNNKSHISSPESNGHHAQNNNNNNNSSNGLNGAQKKVSNGDEPPLNNGLNGSSFSTNDRDYPSDDEDDYCDTSDIINDTDVMLKFKKQLNGDNNIANSTTKPTVTEMLTYSNGTSNGWASTSMNGSAFVPIDNVHHSPSSSTQQQQQQQHDDSELMGLSVMGMGSNEMMLLLERSKTAPDDENRFSALVRKCGGETNSPAATSGLPYGSSQQQLASRQSRPGSSMSQSNMPSGNPSDRRLYGSGAGGGGGGNPPTSTNDYLMAQETNRQILLILMRLREDTNNVLTRLSFLESSVVSLQTNLQMNRIETNGTTSGSSAFALVNSSSSNSQRSPSSSRAVRNSSNSNIFYSIFEFIKTIDWKTVTIAVIWPIIIRLVFYCFKKVRLVIKFKRIRN